ncbi:hypothetical protein CDAR_581871 [Caerostris darwini]|uniref:Uncharacterized protein n=1 Tax=Caerostris darwini TaxID=1538125 RepID=A0AAV4X8B8_9ARAC|nr:hypothetical protein CDAR_581871 [Caerostris darwini]
MDVDLNDQDKLMEGKNRYNELMKMSYGDCWKEALSHLHFSCKHLTEDIQSRLALSFTNCFLEHSGSKTCPCPEEIPMSVCLANSTDRIFSTYTEFFTHTQSICHYLQHREWQEQTHKTIVLLTENSEIVSIKLDESSKTQTKILDMQQVSLLEQRRLISNSRNLNAELQKSRSQARSAFDEFKTSTNEQKLMIFEVFDRIKGLQHFVLGEFTSVYTIAYYIGGIFLIYISTSIPQTANARIWLLLLISANFILERIVVSYNIDQEMLKLFPLEVNGPIYSSIWICRKCVCTIGLIILVYFYHCYQDYNTINNQLLREIQRQNSELQEAIKNLKINQIEALPSQKLKSEILHSNQILNHAYSLYQAVSSISSTLNEKIEMVNDPINASNQFDSIEDKEENTKQINTTPKDVIQSSKENLEKHDSAQKRYNLRSRGNTPVQSPISMHSSPKNDFVNSVTKKIREEIVYLK